VNDAVRAPDVVERMGAVGMEPAGTTPEQYAKLLRDEHERFGGVIRRIGMRLD
jgi:tripartite-type tricarboxylate transporter receptor subunit TctC